MSKKFATRLMAVPAFVAATAAPAMAALSTEVTTGIETAKGDLTTLLGTLTAAGIAVFVAAVIYRRFKVK